MLRPGVRWSHPRATFLLTVAAQTLLRLPFLTEGCPLRPLVQPSRHLGLSERSRCGVVRILRSLAQPSRHFGPRQIAVLILRSLAQPSCHFSLRSCQEVPCRDLAKRPLIESLYRGLAKGPFVDILYRDIAYRFAEILPRDLLHRSCQESSCRELVQRSLQEILPGDAFSRACIETLPRDLL